MKRVILAVLGLLLVANLCMAQSRQLRFSREQAIQELQASGLSAAHPSIPLGSKVKLTNPANGLEVEVTIIERMPPQDRLVIDLSPSAARALDLTLGGPVIVTTLSAPPAPVPAVPSNVVETETVEAEAEKPQLPFNIIINNYMFSPEEKYERPVRQHRSDRDIADDEFFEPVFEPEPVVLTPPEPVPVLPEPSVSASLFDSPPVNNIQIIPGLPNPHSGKTYRLLVGAYPGVDNAFRVHQQLQAAGFDVLQEQAGDMCKVFATGIPASRVYYAAQRLGAIGFQQVWIHE